MISDAAQCEEGIQAAFSDLSSARRLDISLEQSTTCYRELELLYFFQHAQKPVSKLQDRKKKHNFHEIK